jgi:hypothetical protein
MIYPFMQMIGESLAIFLANPAEWVASTTVSTFLYAPGASSAIP